MIKLVYGRPGLQVKWAMPNTIKLPLTTLPQSVSTGDTLREPLPVTRIMSFDFGTQKMGMAFGQTLTQTAEPLGLFPMHDGIPQWEALMQVVFTWQPDLCLVGLPLNMDGTESDLSRRARKFARRLKHRLNKPVWMIDERLSTREARATLQELDKRGKRHSADAFAAVMLVECWCRHPVGIVP